ncbi:MAG: ABC transporter substrate-binding protein [Bdellovibrionales bacterium]
MRFYSILFFLLFSIQLQAKEVRWISLDPAITEWIYYLGLEEYLIGRTNHCNYPAEAKTITPVGDYNRPLFEVIAKLKPTQIFALELGRDSLKKESIRFGTEFVSLPAKKLSDLFIGMDKIIRTLDKADKEILLKKRALQRLKTLKLRYQKMIERKNEVDKKFIVLVDLQPIFVAGGNNYVNELISLCRGKNIFAPDKNWPRLSLEQLLKTEPDQVYVFQRSLEKYKAQSILKKWFPKPYSIPTDPYSRLGPRLIEQGLILCQNK